MSTVQLAGVHARYILLETVRVPIAIIGSLVFPALSLLFFVVPQRAIADDPVFATQAIASLCVFAVMTNALFSFGLNISEAREKPWDPYLRTLPASGASRVLGQVMSTGALGLASVIPVVVVGALTTAAEVEPLRLLMGALALVAAALPFMFLGIAIGYAMPTKAAIAVVQVLMFGLAFGGGLFLPPLLFADWLDAVSRVLPSRQARELVIWALQGGELAPWVWLGVIGWGLVFLVLALVLFRRDEGRRFH